MDILETYVAVHLEKLKLVRGHDTIKEEFTSFIEQLKRATNNLLQTQTVDLEVLRLLKAVEKFRAFDELSWRDKAWQKLALFKFQPNYFNEWKQKGKYLSDLDKIEIKLRAIRFKLDG